MKARYYNESPKRLLSLDPASLYSPKQLLTDPQQLNLYSYVRNNPIRFNDPTGKYSVKSGRVEKGDTLKSITKVINSANKTNYTVQQVAKLNGISSSNPLRINQILIPNNSVKDITNSLINISRENSKDKSINEIGKFGTSGIRNFYKKVNTNGDWDFKHKSDSEFYSKNNINGFVFDGDKVGLDFPGNFHFGYVGTSTWWGNKQVLLGGAGIAQLVSDHRNPKATLLDNIPPYFDNPGDSSQITKGIEYYKNN